MNKYDPNESVDCSPVQHRHQKTLNRRSRRKLYHEQSMIKINPDTSHSIATSNKSGLKIRAEDSSQQCSAVLSNFNILHELHLMAKADRLPVIESVKNTYSNNSECFLTASQFRHNTLFTNNIQAFYDFGDSEVGSLCSNVKSLVNETPLISSIMTNNNPPSHSSMSCMEFPANQFCIDIFNDFTEIEDNNSLSPIKNNISPPPFRYKQINLRTYNGPKLKSKLINSPESFKENEMDSGSDTNSEFSQLKSIPSSPIKFTTNIVKSSQNITKNILDLSLMYLNSTTYSLDSLNFDDQHTLESKYNNNFEINQDEPMNETLISDQLFESVAKNDVNIIHLEETNLSLKKKLTPLSLSPKNVDNLSLGIQRGILKVKHKTEYKTEYLDNSNNADGYLKFTRKSERLANSKSKYMKFKNKKCKNSSTSNNQDTQDTQHLTPIGEFLNESNERQLRIYEKINRISSVFNEDENSDDDEDFRGFDNSDVLVKEPKEFDHEYNKSTQNLLNEYLEEDLDVFYDIDESHYSTCNVFKGGTMNKTSGATQSLLNDSFMDCPNVLKDVDLLLNRSEFNQPIEKSNKICSENLFDTEFWTDEDMFKDIKTQNFILANKDTSTTKENLNKCHSTNINFKTPTRPPLNAKFRNLQRLYEIQPMNVPKFEGFKTGSGNVINISSGALNQAKDFMGAALKEFDLEKKEMLGLIDEKAILVDFMAVEFDKVDNNPSVFADKLLNKDPFGEQVNLPASQERKANNPLRFSGFKFVNGKNIHISDQAMKRANSILEEAYCEKTADLTKVHNQFVDITLPSVKQIKDSETKNEVSLNSDCNQNIKINNCENIISKKKIDETYKLPRKILKYDLQETPIRKQQVGHYTKIDNDATYDLALSVKKRSILKLPSNDELIFNTPTSTAVKLNCSKTPSTLAKDEYSNKFSTPLLADFYNSLTDKNKSTPHPRVSPIGSNSLYFDDLKPLNNTTNLDLDNSKNGSITQRGAEPSPNTPIGYIKDIQRNHCKPPGLRKGRSRLSFSIGSKNR